MFNPLEMMKNLENTRAMMEKAKEKLPSIKCTGYALGNMIEVVANGEMKIESIKIDPSIVKEGQGEMLEVLIASAVNNALENVRSRIQQEAGNYAQELGFSL